MACFGSPKFDRRPALHILSADSRFPDLRPGEQLAAGNHFLAVFPVPDENDEDGQRRSNFWRRRRKRLRGGDCNNDDDDSSKEEDVEDPYRLIINHHRIIIIHIVVPAGTRHGQVSAVVDQFRLALVAAARR